MARQSDLTPEWLGRHLFTPPPYHAKGQIAQKHFMLVDQKRPRTRNRSIDGDEGVDFVRCRICGDHRRVISGRHLSKHDTDRETYMEEYHLLQTN
jgi:hypothetical protein